MSDDYKKKGKKINRPKVESDDDEEDFVNEEIEDEIQYHDDSDEDQNEEGSDEEIDNELHDIDSFAEINIDVDSVAVDKKTKERLKTGHVSDILVFELQSTLGSLEPVIELRSDVPYKAARKGIHSMPARSGHQISDIQSISLLSVSNTFPVSISANINGLKDPKASKCRKNGVAAHIIANPSSDENLISKPRLIMCPIKKKVDPFLEKYPDLSIDKISKSVAETAGLSLLEKGSPLADFITSEMRINVKSVNDKLFAVSSAEKEKAIAEISKRLESKNICDIRDITLTVERAWPKAENGIVQFFDHQEIEAPFPENISSSQLDEIKKSATKSVGRLRIQLEVIHRPLSNTQ
jgi:hypothetical protein